MIMQMEIASIIKVQPCINWLRFYSDNFFSRHSGSSSNLRSSTLYAFGIGTGITGTNTDLLDHTNTQISECADLPALPPGKSWSQYFLCNIPIKWYAGKITKVILDTRANCRISILQNTGSKIILDRLCYTKYQLNHPFIFINFIRTSFVTPIAI